MRERRKRWRVYKREKEGEKERVGERVCVGQRERERPKPTSQACLWSKVPWSASEFEKFGGGAGAGEEREREREREKVSKFGKEGDVEIARGRISVT